MIDIIKKLELFSHEGFEAGYFIVSDKHVRFYLIHRTKQMRLEILGCLHEGDEVRFNFKLIDGKKTVLEQNTETEGDVLKLLIDIHAIVAEHVDEKSGEGKEESINGRTGGNDEE